MSKFDRLLIWPAFLMLLLTVISLMISLFAIEQVRQQFSDIGFFTLHLVPLPFAWVALWPRNGSEKYVSALAFSLSAKTSWRRMLSGPFAPYQGHPGKSIRAIKRSGPIAIFAIAGVVGLFSGWMVPAFSFFAFIALLRRSAYAGNEYALIIEKDFLRLRYPTKACITANALLA